MHKPRIGITVGDIHGIGPEIIIKTFENQDLLKMCTPIIFGNSKVFSYYKNISKSENFQYVNTTIDGKIHEGKVNMINAWSEHVNIELGKIVESGGQCAHISLEACVNALKDKKIDAMVTAPINKKSMHLADFPHPGHTEYLAKASGHEALMILCSDDLRVALVSAHIPVKEISKSITKDKITNAIKKFNKALVEDFGIDKPVIAVLGLNPHAGDDGVLGDEEINIIRPAVVEAKKSGFLVNGPFAADGFFGSSSYKKFDGILSMYHDQGLVGFKALSFGEGVNYSAGLSFIRTSPDHGTGFDIAGQNIANPASFRKALYYAIDIYPNRFDYHDSRKNALKSSKKRSERN